MVVCICANVDDKRIREALEKGEDLKDLNVCQNCCICQETVRELEAEHRSIAQPGSARALGA